MSQRLFLVDIEATGPTPHSSLMTEFGIVDFTTRHWFHGHLYDSHPDPAVPARPVADDFNPGFTATSNGLPGFDGQRHTIDLLSQDREFRVYSVLRNWLEGFGNDRPVFVSDNPAFDYMWMADAFDRHHMPNPFGHSARRIGDLAAGLSGNWRKTSAWKSLRKTRHDHNPVNDSLGNAEALHALLVRHDQIPAPTDT